MALVIGMLTVLDGCATAFSIQAKGSVQVSVLTLSRQSLETHGLAFLTPSSVTGQEEDKQALALSFFDGLNIALPDNSIEQSACELIGRLP